MSRWEQLRPGVWRLAEPIDPTEVRALMVERLRASSLLRDISTHRRHRGRCTACEEFRPCHTAGPLCSVLGCASAPVAAPHGWEVCEDHRPVAA